MGHGPHLLAIGVVVAFFDAFGIGANDVSNSLATAVNSGVWSMKQAAVAAPVLEFVGATVAGGAVSKTISKGILSANKYAGKEGLLQVSFVCALLASSIWLQIANRYSLPVSTTHSIIGATIGVGVAAFGVDAVQWGFSKPKVLNGVTLIPTDGFGPIWVSWFASPIVAGVFASVTFALTKYIVLETNAFSRRIHRHSFWRAVYVVPFFYGFVAAILVLMLAYKGVSADSSANDLAKAAQDNEKLAVICVIVGIVITILSFIYVSWWQVRTTWHGETLQWYEWSYHFLIKKRPQKAGFDAAHRDWEAKEALEAGMAAGSASVPSDKVERSDPEAGTDPTPALTQSTTVEDPVKPTSTTSAITDEQAGQDKTAAPAEKKSSLLVVAEGFFTSANELEQSDAPAPPKPTHPSITAAQQIAAQEGYVIREMTETEKVLAEYKRVFRTGTWKQRILLPFKFIFCFGIIGADGHERAVQHYGEDDPAIKAMHAVAKHYDVQTEIFFNQLQMLTSMLALFAHGSNDTANAIGPFAVIYGVYAENGSVAKGWNTETWMLAFGGVSIGLGFLMYGYHLMRTLGNHLTFMSPSRGYCMEFGASLTVILASQIGMPVSTTQCITGATIAVGAMEGVKAVNWRRFAKIFGGWMLTVPLVAIWSGLVLSFVIYSPTLACPTMNASCQLQN